MQIIWFKRDLRLQDSRPLFESLKRSNIERFGSVLPIYIHEPSQIEHPDVSRQHQMFVQETLGELAEDFEAIGGRLVELCGEAIEVFKRIHAQHTIAKVWSHRETTNQAGFTRDVAVRGFLSGQDIPFDEMPQNGIARGAEVRQSFPDYFAESVRNHTVRDPRGVDLTARFATPPFHSVDPVEIPLAGGADKAYRARGGRKAAEAIMQVFFQANTILAYPKRLSSPNSAFDGCSRLSPYLAYGVISDVEIFQAVDRAVTDANGSMPKIAFHRFESAARFYLDRLAWRRDYMQTFEDQPDLEYKCMLPEFNGLRPQTYDPELMTRFEEGRTGFPFVDALMRCLRATGHIHMRGRATLASFATMNLFLPVFSGDQDGVARLLARQFIDWEPAVHFPILQLISGTTPFERMMVYNPIKAGFDHDPKGDFVRQWLPELSDLEGGAALQPELTSSHLSQEAFSGGYEPYPSPIVDAKASAKFAKDCIKRIQSGKSAKEAVSKTGSLVDQPSLF
ncbi:deoxyribodipyrimidine photo-lyase [Marinobacter sp. es.042]|nr:deoxyribodipyrimidine photo-lyase [Marinobacter sp. es.042]